MLARCTVVGLALSLLLPAPLVTAQEDAPAEQPAPIAPADAIRAYLASDLDVRLPPQQRAQQALELYWALLWGERQDALQKAAIERAERVLKDARARAGGRKAQAKPALLALEAWVARTKAGRASTRAQSGTGVYRLFLGGGALALDRFPLQDLPEPMHQYQEALDAADSAVRAAQAYFDSLAGAAEPTTLLGAQLWIEAGERLSEQELGREGQALMARRAYDNWLKNQDLLLYHYGVQAGGREDGGSGD